MCHLDRISVGTEFFTEDDVISRILHAREVSLENLAAANARRDWRKHRYERHPAWKPWIPVDRPLTLQILYESLGAAIAWHSDSINAAAAVQIPYGIDELLEQVDYVLRNLPVELKACPMAGKVSSRAIRLKNVIDNL